MVAHRALAADAGVAALPLLACQRFLSADDARPLERFAPVLSQLTHLEISNVDKEDFVLALPKLRRLRLPWLSPDDVPWITGMPSLTALSVECVYDSAHYPVIQALNTLSPVLIALGERRGLRGSTEALQPCTQLRSLSVDRLMLSEVHCLWPIAPQVDTMSITIA